MLQVLIAGLLAAEAGAVRPVCKAENMGQMWPEAANHDPRALNKLAHCGELLICTRTYWHYRWQPLTVRLDQLRHRAGASKPGVCEPEVAASAVPAENPMPAAR